MITKFTFVGICAAICVTFPAVAQSGRNPPGVNPTHYQCYEISADTAPVSVKSLRDQFGVSGDVKIGRALFLCAPTAKNGAAPRDRVTHYLCYEDEGVKPAGRKAQVVNQFTKENGVVVGVEAPKMLCVPSRKKLL